MNAYTLGVVCGILVVVLIAIICKLIWGKKQKAEEEFDERQLLERGNAYKLGFTAYMIEFAIYILLSLADFGFEIPAEPTVLAVTALFIPLTIFCVYAVRHDAFMGYNVTSKKYYIVYILAFVANLIPSIISLIEGNMIEDGKLTFHTTNLLVAIMFGGILLALFVKNKEDKEEE